LTGNISVLARYQQRGFNSCQLPAISINSRKVFVFVVAEVHASQAKNSTQLTLAAPGKGLRLEQIVTLGDEIDAEGARRQSRSVFLAPRPEPLAAPPDRN
jgi:hypothetical protein